MLLPLVLYLSRTHARRHIDTRLTALDDDMLPARKSDRTHMQPRRTAPPSTPPFYM